MCTCLDDDATTFLATGSWATQMSDPRCKAQRVTRNAKEKTGSGVITSRYNAKKFFWMSTMKFMVLGSVIIRPYRLSTLCVCTLRMV